MPFYLSASIVLTLTNPQMAIETFGLTALEAMRNGLPVIVPTKGDIAELVSDGENGYTIDVMELKRIERTIALLFADRVLYLRLSSNALQTSLRYDSKRQSALLATQLSY